MSGERDYFYGTEHPDNMPVVPREAVEQRWTIYVCPVHGPVEPWGGNHYGPRCLRCVNDAHHINDVPFLRQTDVVPASDQKELRDLLRWLVSMDDPEDVLGRAERQQITLTKIIDRARGLLDSGGHQ